MTALAQPLDPTEAITPRELDVLRLMCTGVTNKDIAYQLGISVRTVECHRQRLLDKSGCRTACALGVWAVRRGLIEMAECA